MRARRVFAAATPLLLAMAFSCSFPEVTFQEGGVDGGSPASASSGAGSSVGGSGQGGQGGGQGGESQSASATGGGQGGLGGQGGQGGQGGTVDCTDPDKDSDTYASVACMGTDCDDGNEDVFPAQTNYFDKPRANGSFDYNCNMVEEREFETVNCSGAFCSMTNVFLGDPMKPAACGSMANFGDCSGVSCEVSNLSVKPMRCR